MAETVRFKDRKWERYLIRSFLTPCRPIGFSDSGSKGEDNMNFASKIFSFFPPIQIIFVIKLSAYVTSKK